ncbi:MAG: HAD-IA family hydrolase [Magnetococcales bacterium]|nr:HAD-IA family hydrolase [Magnetococcales bacterium]
MFVFLDIGFTLLGGPAQGPAARLMAQFDLPSVVKPGLNHLLFATPLSAPEELAQYLERTYGLPVGKTQGFIIDLWQKQVAEAFPLPGAKTLLTRLQSAKIPFAFITNIWAPFLDGFKHHFSLDWDRHPIFASFQLGCLKPDPEIFHIALRHTACDPRQAIMIGDTYETDIAPALALGMKTIWVLSRPDKERCDLAAVLNQSKPAPHHTVADVLPFDIDRLKNL